MSIVTTFVHAQEALFTAQYADSCYVRGIAEFYKCNYKTAESHFKLSWDINDSIQRNAPFLSSNTSDWIAYILYLEGRITEAQDLSVDYCFLPVDQRHTRQSDSLWVLVSECTDLGQSLYLSELARSIEISNLGNKHYYIANSDQQIASLYMQLGRWDFAKQYQEEAIDIFEKCISTDYTQTYIITLLEYIRTSVHLCDMPAYEKTIAKCKEAAHQLFGDVSYSYAYTLYELARANDDFDDFVECISNAKEATKIYTQLLPSKAIEMQLVMCYQLIGNAYGYINNYQEAKSYLQLANSVLEKNKNIGDEILFDIAYYQGKCGEYDNALATYKKLVNLLEKYYLPNDRTDKKHAQRLLISSHLDMAEIFYNKKEIDSTIKYASDGLFLAEKYDFPTKQLEAIQTLSLCYYEQSLYSKAIELQEHIMKVDSNNTTNIYNLMWSYYMVKNMKGFYNCATQYYTFEQNEILSTFSKIYESNRLEYLENGDFERFSYPIRFAREYNNNDTICCLAYNSVLFRKGLLLTSSIEFSRIISECDEEIQNSYQQLMQIRERLNHPLLEQNREKLIEEQLQIEGFLLKQIPMWSENITQLQYTWKDVQNMLTNNEVAIEFAEDVSNNTSKMIALIIRSGWNSPRCVVLDEFNCNSDRIRNYDYSAFADSLLSNSIWGGIIKEAQIRDHETVYFAADGAFRVFPIEYLCNPKDTQQTISERFDIVRLSSTRVVCSQKEDAPLLSISLYGNLIYDISEEQKIANSRLYTPSRYCAADNKQCPMTEDFIRAGYRYLYWTKTEIDSIEQFAINFMPQLSIYKYELDKGTEESFKDLSKKSTTIIHLATHAFYYDNLSYEGGCQSEGLLMSGCNTTCADTINVQDGILCSSEIELLDLRNTSLLVLSACNTGLGNSMVDGIGGLQRAFKKAGVSTIIMSLWEVSDIATSYFMQQFYKSLFITKSKRKAFIQAQQQTKEKFEDPYYWASFIMLD